MYDVISCSMRCVVIISWVYIIRVCMCMFSLCRITQVSHRSRSLLTFSASTRYDTNISTMVKGMHHHQAIVILAFHFSSKNLCCPHGTTMSDAILLSCACTLATVIQDNESCETNI